MSAGSPVSDSSRLPALDGLRGVAAAIVVAYHFVLATHLSDDYLRVLAGGSSDSGAVNLLANTPVRYLIMGPEAVVVFFVLSGFVLVLPLLRGKGLDLWNYFPRRVLRLWLPSAAAVVLAVVVILATPQDPAGLPSSWAQAFSFPAPTVTDVASSFFLITGSPVLNNPLWTLRWELLFSLLLPVVFVVIALIRRGRTAWIIVCGAATGLGALWGVPALTYGPMFLVGGILAAVFSARGQSASPFRTWSAFVGGLVLLAVPDMVRLWTPEGARVVLHPLSQAAVVWGAALLVLALSSSSHLSRFFSLRPFRFLGRISFSLYLVHVPLVLGAVHLLPEHPYRALMIVAPVIFAVSWLFCRYIEEPAARLGRVAGTRTSLVVGRIADRASARP
ncbi:acyltransferase family protein [Microbacterium sp. 179-I 3D4 NHS]|uniref:acyltransferase family protein n=1 Tax=Microbacterium sp. 179-I 3D4 NHS TaxID=3142381 RepID=UPI0039A07C05